MDGGADGRGTGSNQAWSEATWCVPFVTGRLDPGSSESLAAVCWSGRVSPRSHEQQRPSLKVDMLLLLTYLGQAIVLRCF
jgi:hypothetical protein